MAVIEIRVPDIGDFKEVTVIEVLVAAGDTVKPEQSLITVESDKASMEIPSPHAGVLRSLAVKVGDKVSQGVLLANIETAEAAAPAPAAPAAPAPQPAAQPAPAPVAAASGDAYDCDLLVLGGGPGGYSAAFRAADLGMKVVLVERFPTLGGVCLNVGCIPSKALLHVAAVVDEAAHLAAAGVSFGTPQIDLDQLRAHKQKVVSKLTGGLAAMAKMRKVTVVQGVGAFAGPHELAVELSAGGTQTIRFAQAIIAAGSEAVKLPFLPDDERIVTSTGALQLRQRPKKMLVIGGGIIGLEMGTVYSTLGARLDVVEMLDGLMAGADRDLVKVWQKMNAHRFDRLMLKTRTVGAEATADGIRVQFEAADGTRSDGVYDLVLQAVGRRPNGRAIGAERAGVQVDERGFVPVDVQMRTNVPHIFAIGDLVGQPMLAHKAVHEGHVAAEVAAGDDKARFDARVIPGVAYTDPEVAWVGLTEDEAKARGVAVKKGLFPWSASGRAIANGRDEGFTKLLFDAQTHRILGGGIVGTHAGDMIGEVALAIEMGADEVDIGRTIHPHPTLGESLGLAAEAAHGSCTDLPPARR
ncbi:dihydrolipoyl dehydrogenase [Rubrivivax gelatinosus]|uniref:Dihydrolipoyl dehydrogenase n=1 Tax=Rubrivivax gelatinosus (strain NBRC 100245 / IL144) TaxID=983917 RepID=I0HRS1_RUBGI|nr:dihydrolipoyl dehydrogenase [Rubrivivax gelatinosus]BAL95708.1 dihydrolipoamide dehydrogenase LpdA [Rubrivivax gelatinosus IL144]